MGGCESGRTKKGALRKCTSPIASSSTTAVRILVVPPAKSTIVAEDSSIAIPKIRASDSLINEKFAAVSSAQ